MIPQYRPESKEADCTLELMAGNFVREILSEIKDRKPRLQFGGDFFTFAQRWMQQPFFKLIKTIPS
jgi:hypothetical protein